jgi:hypothetical protein
MSDLTPPPVRAKTPPPPVVATSRVLWLLSFVAGFLVIAFAFLSTDARLERLREFVADIDADAPAETLDGAASALFWIVVGALGVVLLLEAALLGAMLKQRRFARWVAIPVVAVQIAVILVANELLALGAEGPYFSIALIVQLALAGAALVASFLPGSGPWFRERHDTAAG